MFFDGEYRLLASVDVSALRVAVDRLTDDDWLADTSRQEVFAPHRKTQTIGLIYDPDMRHENPSVLPAYDRFKHAVAPILAAVADSFNTSVSGSSAYFVRVILVRLEPKHAIGTHRDFGPSLSRAHRIHVPVKTNPKAEFGIAGHVRHLPSGEAWEINNRKPHAVRNEGDEYRVHLILDYVIPGEVVEDPDGTLIA